MALIHSPRWYPGDLEAWKRASAGDLAASGTPRHRKLVEDAEMIVSGWARGRRGYVSVSWGKDSMVLAHICRHLGWPLVWCRMPPREQPDCFAVRDAFLSRYPWIEYDEIVVPLDPNLPVRHAPDGTRAIDVAYTASHVEAARRHGEAYFVGYRQEENRNRKMFRSILGIHTDRVCCPLIDWKGADIFAYLAGYDLPIHPAYAMLSLTGNRNRLRVSTMGSPEGDELGRYQWEARYYPEFREDY